MSSWSQLAEAIFRRLAGGASMARLEWPSLAGQSTVPYRIALGLNRGECREMGWLKPLRGGTCGR